MRELKSIAIIPARSGSKGLPDKNIRPLNGIPLIAYTIKAALDSGMFDTVMVSTDSEKYAEIARKYGAEVPFLRSAATSGDKSSSWDAVKEVLAQYESQLGKTYDVVALLQVTSPLRTGAQIAEAFEKMEQMDANSVYSIRETEYPVFWAQYVSEDFCMNKSERVVPVDPRKYMRRQKASTSYRANGAIYLYKTEALRTEAYMYETKCYGYVMDKIASVDVDDLEDFAIAEALVQYLPEYINYFA